jgi:hypothetical protein
MTIERADMKDLETSQQNAAEARKEMQIALHTWGRDNVKSRAAYQARVRQRLDTMEEKIESSIRGIINKVEQEMAPRTRKVSHRTEYKV